MSLPAQQLETPSRNRSPSLTIRRDEIDVPDPMDRPSSSGRYLAVEPSDEIAPSRPGPVSRWIVLGLIVVGVVAVLSYAWLRHANAASDAGLIGAADAPAAHATRVRSAKR